ncbi:MAG: hypothetical protein ACI4RA_08120 [Kiritimatiellia bacterium]
MTFWFFLLGVPLLGYGLVSLLFTDWTAKQLVAFPRNRAAGCILCAVGWFWTAYECDTIGIDVFDKFLKVFPGEVWILALVLTVLMCWWMPNLLSIRGVSALFMLFPGEMFPVIRLCDTPWRLTLVVFAYICAITGMFGMFYPWRIRQALAWRAARPLRVRVVGAVLAAVGALFLVLGACAAAGVLK